MQQEALIEKEVMMQRTAQPATGRRMLRRVIISSVLGNAFEWFDFAIFATFASVISKLYFPTVNPVNSLLLGLATFGVAFAVRPVGGLILGLYADRFGRKRALSLMIILMAVGTGLIGILPTYASIGIAAPLLMMVARIIQGFSISGEFPSASAMLIEFAPRGRRGLVGSAQMCSQSLAYTVGAAFGYLISSNMDTASFETWGWRVPFLLGILVGPIGYYIRRRVDETPEFEKVVASRERGSTLIVREAFSLYGREMFTVFCIVVLITVSQYVVVIYVPIYALRELHLGMRDVQLSAVISTMVIIFLCPLAGYLSDRFGRRAVMVPAVVIYNIVAYVLISHLLAEPSLANLVLAQVVACAAIAFLWGPVPALMTEVFPVQIRTTALSLVFNLGVLLFGGLAPFALTWVISVTGDRMAPVYYIMFSSVVGMVGLGLLRDHRDSKSVVLPAVKRS
jgi:MHS family proline/betaine transporter-like MFS transporter